MTLNDSFTTARNFVGSKLSSRSGVLTDSAGTAISAVHREDIVAGAGSGTDSVTSSV